MINEFQVFESLCRARIETDSNRTHLRVRQITNIVALIFFQSLVQVLFLILFIFRKIKTEKKLPTIFVHSLTKANIYRNNTTDQLFQFLAEKRFPYSNDASDYLVYCKNLLLPKKSQLRVTRSFSLYLTVYCFSRHNIMDLSKTLFSLIVLILRKRTGLKLKARYLFYSILEFCVWTNVESERRIQFITTQSSWSNLPIPFYLQVKNLERHMMWYSTNSIPILKIGEIESKSTLPQSLATYVDMHLVWDDLQVNFFKSQKIYNSRVFGSMLFYPRVVQKMPNKTLSLIYFDVIPQNLFETSFYNTESALNNLESIISVIDEYNSRLGKNLRLKVKHKRTPTRQHSKTYLKRVRNLSDSNLIEIISPSENLYKLIGESKFIIGTPYTSPVIIAKELGVESSFVNLWPSDYLIPDFFNEVPIIKLKDELLKKLLDLN